MNNCRSEGTRPWAAYWLIDTNIYFIKQPFSFQRRSDMSSGIGANGLDKYG
jgi:hypothetical protein